MDAFQVRIDCLALVRRLSASQQSIAKVVDFAIKHAAHASEDVWECLLSEFAKSTLNARLNIFFLLDALLAGIVDPIGYSASSAPSSTDNDTAQTSATSSTLAIAASTYVAFAARDLGRIIDAVVPPDDWDAVRLNESSVQKILQAWKRLGIFSHETLDRHCDQLRQRKQALSTLPAADKTHFSQMEILRRMEEDRERHKRLRERAWILPAKSFVDAIPPRPTAAASGLLMSSAAGVVGAKQTKQPDALDIEFDDMWETVSDLNDDDVQLIREDSRLWWGSTAFAEKQLAAERLRQGVADRTTDEQHRLPGESAHGAAEQHFEQYSNNFKRPSPEQEPRNGPAPHVANRWRKIGPAKKADEQDSANGQGWDRRNVASSGGHRHHERGGRRLR